MEPVNPLEMACHDISGLSASHPAPITQPYPITGTAACPSSGKGDKKIQAEGKNSVFRNLQSMALSVG